MLNIFNKGIAQIAFVVKNLDSAVKNFYEFFGIGPWIFYTYKKPFVEKMTRNGVETDYSMKIALSNIGDIRIELIEQQRGDTVYQDFIDEHGYGVHHLGVVVEDIQTTIKKCADVGIRTTMDGSGFGADGDGHYAYLDTEGIIGTTIELIQRPKVRKQYERIYPCKR